MSKEAQAKWDELDVDSSGELDGNEVMALAEWVWCSFRPGQKINPDAKKKETLKLMRRCDANDDGSLSQEEFAIYYEQTAAAMLKFQDALEKKKNSNTEKEKIKKEKREKSREERQKEKRERGRPPTAGFDRHLGPGAPHPPLMPLRVCSRPIRGVPTDGSTHHQKRASRVAFCRAASKAAMLSGSPI